MHILKHTQIQQLTTNLALIERKVNFYYYYCRVFYIYCVLWCFTVLELNEFLFLFLSFICFPFLI